MSEEIEGSTKKDHRKNFGVRDKKSQGAAKLRSTPGDTHPSYATAKKAANLSNDKSTYSKSPC